MTPHPDPPRSSPAPTDTGGGHLDPTASPLRLALMVAVVLVTAGVMWALGWG